MLESDIEEAAALLQEAGLQLRSRGEARQEDKLIQLLRHHQALGLTQLRQDLPLETKMGGLKKFYIITMKIYANSITIWKLLLYV